MPKDKSQTLQYAASVVFALVAIIPLLMFTYTLVRLNALHDLQNQIALGVTLMAALTGFGILRLMVTRMSNLLYLLHTVRQVAEQGAAPGPAAAKDFQVPGIGPIQEFGQIAEMLWSVSKAKAEPYLGQRVLVSVRNSTRPIAGIVLEVTNDGVLLDDNGREVGVSYRRISTIELDRSPGGLAEAAV
ncbi:MAG TPA: hypothetical protein VK548_23020 [Candidatus Acidoferrum sp.]|nr:hypothetical protein [Candidatus Acidoferrum sp.]